MRPLIPNRPKANPMGLSSVISVDYDHKRPVFREKECGGATPATERRRPVRKRPGGTRTNPSEPNGVKSYGFRGLIHIHREANPIWLSFLFSAIWVAKWPAFCEKDGLRSMSRADRTRFARPTPGPTPTATEIPDVGRAGRAFALNLAAVSVDFTLRLSNLEVRFGLDSPGPGDRLTWRPRVGSPKTAC